MMYGINMELSTNRDQDVSDTIAVNIVLMTTIDCSLVICGDLMMLILEANNSRQKFL